MSAIPGQALEYRGRADGLMEATCWCEATVVLITPRQVFEGQTECCTRARCTPTAMAVAS